MADIKTELRELSVLVGVDTVVNKRDDIFDYDSFCDAVLKILNKETNYFNEKLKEIYKFTDTEIQILRNGYKLSKAIVDKFEINHITALKWFGWDLHKEDPIDVQINDYGFSLKEDSHILKNMGLYQLLNCFTGSSYKKRNIFEDYAYNEYCDWFAVSWNLMIKKLAKVKKWQIQKEKNKQIHESIIKINEDLTKIIMEYSDGVKTSSCELPSNCRFEQYNKETTSVLREHVFAKFINKEISKDEIYLEAKKKCSIVASENLAKELNDSLNYTDGLAHFLGIYSKEYYYAKTTNKEIQVYKVPKLTDFRKTIQIIKIVPFVPKDQANILTTIKNVETGKELVIRNECRFAHGQFNGTPEAKMYYANKNDDLTAIYDRII